MPSAETLHSVPRFSSVPHLNLKKTTEAQTVKVESVKSGLALQISLIKQV